MLLRSGLPLGITIGVLVAHNTIVDYLHMTPALQGAIQQSALARLETQGAASMAAHVIKLGEALFAHISLLVLPCLLALLGYRWRAHSVPLNTKRWLVVLAPGLLLLLYWRFWPPALPVRIFGIAHSVVHGQRSWGAYDEPILFRQTLWAAELAATALMAFFLVALAIGFMRRQEAGGRPDAAAFLFGITTSVFLLAPFVIDGLFMERYLIPVIPFVLLALVALSKPAESSKTTSQPLAPVGAIAILIAYAVVSVAYAHDCLLWNRVRWEAANFLIHEQGIEPKKIDGGLSFNG